MHTVGGVSGVCTVGRDGRACTFVGVDGVCTVGGAGGVRTVSRVG